MKLLIYKSDNIDYSKENSYLSDKKIYNIFNVIKPIIEYIDNIINYDIIINLEPIIEYNIDFDAESIIAGELVYLSSNDSAGAA